MQQHGVVAPGRVDDIRHVDPVGDEVAAVVADPELARVVGARRAVEIHRASDLAGHVQVSPAAGVVLARGLVEVGPLREPVLAPELRVAIVVGHPLDVVVAELVLGLGGARELGLLGDRVGRLIECVVVEGQPELIDAPAPESPLP